MQNVKGVFFSVKQSSEIIYVTWCVCSIYKNIGVMLRVYFMWDSTRKKNKYTTNKQIINTKMSAIVSFEGFD